MTEKVKHKAEELDDKIKEESTSVEKKKVVTNEKENTELNEKKETETSSSTSEGKTRPVTAPPLSSRSNEGNQENKKAARPKTAPVQATAFVCTNLARLGL